MKKCQIENCENLTKRKQYCDLHYKRWKRHGDPIISLVNLELKCFVDDCNEPAKKKLKSNTPMCFLHYGRYRRFNDPTKILINESG